MADDQSILSHEDFFDQQAQDLLLLADVQGIRPRPQLRTETGERFRQQHLVGILATEAIRRVNQHRFEVTGSGQVAQSFQPRPPLLANLYLHWFDKVFHGLRGPARWANAKLVRYADDFVVLARYLTPNLRGWIEEKVENLDGVGDQPGEDARGQPDGEASAPGLSGVHVPI